MQYNQPVCTPQECATYTTCPTPEVPPTPGPHSVWCQGPGCTKVLVETLRSMSISGRIKARFWGDLAGFWLGGKGKTPLIGPDRLVTNHIAGSMIILQLCPKTFVMGSRFAFPLIRRTLRLHFVLGLELRAIRQPAYLQSRPKRKQIRPLDTRKKEKRQSRTERCLQVSA